ncbi:glutamate--tRNA ligase, partial [Candidatus Sumerlaeota bacterium]|nr:glutamate--tRNA ligase [Candidatus Sumerlaeota bacterium]
MQRTKKNIRVRFAPSPTGYLHIGSARTALFNWLFARHYNGVFVLRIEDTDIERLHEDALSSIYDGLRWLGLDWDEGPEVGGPYGPYRQSERLEIYQEYAQRLLREGNAYYCYCLPEELEEQKRQMLARGEAPRYSGRCRYLTSAQRRQLENEGRRPAIRFRMPETDIEVNDIIRGRTVFKAETQGDFVILRRDNRPTYHLANVVDDTLMHISYVIRGEDLYPSTPRHIALYRALGLHPPEFAHLPMILAPDRSKLSKRYGAVSVSWYREQGFIPEAIVNYLALLGWSPPDEQEIKSVEELIKEFSLDRVAKAGAIFDLQKLRYVNA